MATQTTSINSSGTLYVAGGIDEVMIGTGSVFFNGVNQSLSIVNPVIATRVNDFTIEAWVYAPTILAASPTIASTTIGNSNVGFHWYFGANGFGVRSFSVNIVLPANTGAAGALLPNTWYHCAYTRLGNVHSCWLNGVLTNSATLSVNFSDSTLTIGNASVGQFFGGYISNLRLINGTAIYTSNFTVPKAPLNTLYNTTFLMNKIYGQSNTNRIVDSSVYNSTVTNVNSAIPVNVNPFYVGEVGSLSFSGSQSLSITGTTGDPLDLASGALNWTVEFWFYLNSVAGTLTIFEKGGTSGSVNPSYVLSIVAGTGQWVVGDGGTGGVAQSLPSATSANTWYHFALVRNNGWLNAFVNGVTGTPVAMSFTMSNTGNNLLAIGRAGDGATNFINGYITNFRIVKGIAVYATNTNFVVPSRPLTVIGTQTSLLLSTPFASSSTVFKDSSVNNYTVINNGGTTSTTFSPFTGNLSNPPTLLNNVERISTQGLQTAGEIDEFTLSQGSMVFNGSTQRVTLPFGFINPGSQDFTIEAWVYPLASTIGAFFVGQADLVSAGGSSIVCYINGGASTSDLYIGSGSASITSPTCPVGQWSHVAYVRYGATGGTWRSYLNGTLVSSVAVTGAVNAGSVVYPPSIGGFMDSARNMFNGYISNHRIVVGTAVYTSSTFTPPTLPLTSIVNTRSLFSSPNSSRVVQDFSTASNTTTNVGGVTGTGLNPFSAVGSLNFNGVNQNLILSTAASGPLDLATGITNWTVECWFYPLSVTGTQAIFWKGGATGSVNPSYAFFLSGTGGQWIIGDGGGGGGVQNVTVTFAIGQWYHFALVRSGVFATAYINGVPQAPVTLGTMGATSNNVLTIGNSTADGSSRPLNGYISNFRIVKGSAVYSTNTNFTPPTQPLTVMGTQTSLLLSTPFSTQAFIDSSPNNLIVTNTNVTTSTSINPFIGNLGNPASRTNTVQRVSGKGLQVSGSFDEFSMNRGSVLLNGSTQLLTVPTNAGFTFGTGDFTVEGWYYFNSLTGSPANYEIGLALLGTGATAVNFSAWYLRYNANSYGNAVLGFYRYDGTETTNNFSLPSANYFVTNTWYHIACTRQGNNLRMFLNGSQVGATITSSLNFASINADALQIGKVITGNGTYFLNGYVSNFRIVKNVAVYTSNFTRPTTPFSSTDVYSTQTSILLNTVAYPPLNKVDSSLNNFTVTPTAAPLPSELNPFV